MVELRKTVNGSKVVEATGTIHSPPQWRCRSTVVLPVIAGSSPGLSM